MPLLVSPSGKMTPIDNQKVFNEWLQIPGYTKATEEQERYFIEGARVKQLKINAQANTNAGIYLSTVSQGGKDGYAIASKNLIKELEGAGIPVTTHYSGQQVAILFHNPYSITRIEAPYKIIYTMFESTKIPDDWGDYLKAADEVWVPSKWNQAVFKEAGIDTKVVPLGYDDAAYKFIERSTAESTRRDFTFLHYNAFNVRKGFMEVWKAFTSEFNKIEPVKLILKTIANQSPLPITKQEYPNIEIIYGKIEENQMLDIMARSDCFVFPSRGEGFGMTPLETMATGLPAIIPNAHGMSEYFDKDTMIEVAIKEQCPAIYSRYKDMDVGKMYVSDTDDLRKKMRWCVTHQKETLELGKKASEYVKNWTYSKGFATIILHLKDLLARPQMPNKLLNVLVLEKVT